MTKVCQECGRRFRLPPIPNLAPHMQSLRASNRRFCDECGDKHHRSATARCNANRKRECTGVYRADIRGPRRQRDELWEAVPMIRRGYERYMRDPAAVEAACRAQVDPSCRYDLPWTRETIHWQDGIHVPASRAGGGA